MMGKAHPTRDEAESVIDEGDADLDYSAVASVAWAAGNRCRPFFIRGPVHGHLRGRNWKCSTL